MFKNIFILIALSLLGIGCINTEKTSQENSDDISILEINLDTDNDGLIDTEEEARGTDPANQDTDNDGYTDAEEVANGFDPLVAPNDVSLTFTERIEQDINVPADEDSPLTVTGHIGADVTTTVNCGSQTCFEEKFAVCEKAITVADIGLASFSYEIIGPVAGGCAMKVHFPTNPNPAWENQPMTCTFNNSIGFVESVQSIIGAGKKSETTCVGPLVDIMWND